MKREQRLRRRRDFQAAYRKGQAHGDQLLVVRVRRNGGPATRFGFVAGKAVGGAVVRNRVKRRLREAARRLRMRQGYDVVIGARKPAAVAPYAALAGSLDALTRRAGVREPAAAAQEDA